MLMPFRRLRAAARFSLMSAAARYDADAEPLY